MSWFSGHQKEKFSVHSARGLSTIPTSYNIPALFVLHLYMVLHLFANFYPTLHTKLDTHKKLDE
jgi:hypothetical protein